MYTKYVSLYTLGQEMYTNPYVYYPEFILHPRTSTGTKLLKYINHSLFDIRFSRNFSIYLIRIITFESKKKPGVAKVKLIRLVDFGSFWEGFA